MTGLLPCCPSTLKSRKSKNRISLLLSRQRRWGSSESDYLSLEQPAMSVSYERLKDAATAARLDCTEPEKFKQTVRA
ncbi:DNA-binding domain-containing protein [Vibrio metschnikovii]